MDYVTAQPTMPDDFHNDMNKHPGEYATRSHHYIELEQLPSGAPQITVWKPQEEKGKYVAGDGDCIYHWNAIAREKNPEWDWGQAIGVLNRLANNKSYFDEFVEQNDYDGPREWK